MNAIKMNDFAQDPPELVAAEVAACARVIRSGWWILGKEVAAFETAWADLVGARTAVGCANGLDAIELGLRALDIGSGDEVVTTSMTAFATVLGILRAGATPVLADIDPQTAMLSPESVARCISPRTKAILLVHLYGQIGPVDELLALASNRGIRLLEDCAQAHGARYRGRAAGTFGSFGAWSFYPTKNLGAIGDAGALTASSAELLEKARSLRNYGQSARYYHPLRGMNSRLDELQAALLAERIAYLPQWLARRRQVAERYTREITNPLVQRMPLPADAARHAHHLFVVRCDRRSDLQSYLQSLQIESLIHYPVPVHMQESCRDVARDPVGLPVTETHARTCLSLPCHPGLSDEQVTRVIAAVQQFGA